MLRRFLLVVLSVVWSSLCATAVQAAFIQTQPAGTNRLVRIQGDPDNEWLVQSSFDLATWSHVPGFRPLVAGRTNAPWRPVGGMSGPLQFFRAVQTGGLFDSNWFRTISLTFTQADWATRLASGRANGSNVLGRLTLDNGATNFGIGARYKGNTSYSRSGVKKSINLEMDFTNATGRLLGYKTVNLNNAFGDETILREPVYFNAMHRYAASPKGSMARLFINGEDWGVYSFVQQENNELIKEWFPSDLGDRWKAPNAAGGGGGFSGSNSALAYLGTNVASYRGNYELKTMNSTNPWLYLIRACDVLNLTPAASFRDRVQSVMAVDHWLWFLAVENIFADDDSYFNKGADYGFYYEPESGRLHPLEHDGNEAFVAGDVQLSPLQGAGAGNRPVLNRLLSVPDFRQRYLAHLRTVLEESYRPDLLTPVIDHFVALSVNAIIVDPKKPFTMAAYTNDLRALKTFVTNRYNYLANHAEVRPVAPDIGTVQVSLSAPTALDVPTVTVQVTGRGADGVDSVWLHHRGKSYGRFVEVRMLDDGQHGDGAAGDGVFGAATTNYPAGSKVRFYIEARSGNASRTARFAPARAEQETFSYRVIVTTASNSPVVINELMASNTRTLADPQGQFDDWIELRNVTDQEVDLTGRYLSDEPNNPRKWAFPAGTKIAPDGYLLVWADEDGMATEGLHASFKLSGSGEEIFLTDTDANQNAILDSIAFGPQETDRAYGRTEANADVWAVLDPTPGQANR